MNETQQQAKETVFRAPDRGDLQATATVDREVRRVEAHIRHPRLGWIELGGAGIFRPEVTYPLGVTAPVLAWGLGLDRMAMVALKINDIRELFSRDLDAIRTRRLELELY